MKTTIISIISGDCKRREKRVCERGRGTARKWNSHHFRGRGGEGY